MEKIALVGTYPPPIGGISVHVKRLQQSLTERGVGCVVYDMSAESVKAENVVPSAQRYKLLMRLFFSPERIVHFHGHNWRIRAMLLLLKAVSKRVVFTFHSFRDDVESIGPLRRSLIRVVVRLADYIIVTNPQIQDKLIRLGARAEKMTVIPPFIPPQIRQQDIDRIPAYVWSFIDTHSPVISANAYRISFYRGEDLYGLDMCIELCNALKQDWPKVGLVFCLPVVGDEAYYAHLQARIRDLGLEGNWLFVNELSELYPILMRSDLFVRPTNTDSYGMSVAEAIYLGIPAVASNVCPRAPGTQLFKSRDIEDFVRVVSNVLKGRKGKESTTVTEKKSLRELDYVQAILDVYESLSFDKS